MSQNKAGELTSFTEFPAKLIPLVRIFEAESGQAQEIADFLASHGFRVEIASRPFFAGESYPDETLPIFVANLNGLKASFAVLARQYKDKKRPFSLILLSAPDPEGIDLQAIKEGLVDHVVNPGHLPALLSAIRSETEKEKYRRQLNRTAAELKMVSLVKERSLKRAAQLEEIYNATLENLMTALDLRDVETFGHSRVVARYSQALAQVLGIADTSRLEHIRQGALLHDVGKIAIPDSILKKPGTLTVDEWEKIKMHPALGYGLIKEIKLVEEVGHVILYHHEHYDGQGYPYGLKREKIPLEARIFALADALDAITSHRPYRQERDFKTARDEILKARGRQFDPQIVDAFCALKLDDWEKIRYETSQIGPALDEIKVLSQKRSGRPERG